MYIVMFVCLCMMCGKLLSGHKNEDNGFKFAKNFGKICDQTDDEKKVHRSEDILTVERKVRRPL